MGKKIIFTVLFALTTILAQAQQIKVEYENKISSLPELIQQYFEMQKVYNRQNETSKSWRYNRKFSSQNQGYLSC